VILDTEGDLANMPQGTSKKVLHHDASVCVGAPRPAGVLRAAGDFHTDLSFIGRLRDEPLNETLFTSLAHVREALKI
jgi:hypothetical protein